MLVSKAEFASLLVCNLMTANKDGQKSNKVVRAKTLSDLLAKAVTSFKEGRATYGEAHLKGGAYYPITLKGARVSLGEPRTESGDLAEFRAKLTAAIGEC